MWDFYAIGYGELVKNKNTGKYYSLVELSKKDQFALRDQETQEVIYVGLFDFFQNFEKAAKEEE